MDRSALIAMTDTVENESGATVDRVAERTARVDTVAGELAETATVMSGEAVSAAGSAESAMNDVAAVAADRGRATMEAVQSPARVAGGVVGRNGRFLRLKSSIPISPKAAGFA